MPPFIIGDDALLLAPSGTRLANALLEEPKSQQTSFHIYPVINSILIASEDEESILGFKLPELYDFFPEFVRVRDVNLVDSPDVPVYAWDSVPRWDTTPFQWDQVIGPEPILKTTFRIIQLELEKICQETEDLLLNYNLSRNDKKFLPYLSAQLGAPLPSASERAQRSFLRQLVRTYRKKGTPASFRRMLESLGFDLTIVERYQKKKDASFVDGPQIRQESSNLVMDEPIGTTGPGVGPYRFVLMERPIQRGSVKLEIFADSATIPIEVIDNSNGGWSDDFEGSIDYRTGLGSITLKSPPGLVGQPINATYRFFVDEFPDPFKVKYTDIWRSSVVSISLEPKNSAVSLTPELIDRMFLYLGLLKPAHIVLRNLDIVFSFEETETVTDDLQPVTFQFLESVFENHYIGAPWNAEDNASIDPNPAVADQHRSGPEFLVKEPSVDPTVTPSPPYVYPWRMDGKFSEHAVGTDYDWVPTNDTFEAVITNDVSPTTTNFSISKTGIGTLTPQNGDLAVLLPDLVRLLDGGGSPDGAKTNFSGTVGPATILPIDSSKIARLTFEIGGELYEEIAIGGGNFSNRNGFLTSGSVDFTTGAVSAVFNEAPDNTTQVEVTTLSVIGSGEAEVIQTIVDSGTYWDITVSSAFGVAPTVGARAIILEDDSPQMDRLEAGNREEDPLSLLFGEALSPAPNGVNLGPFTVTIIASHRPLVGTSILRYVRDADGQTYEETASGTGSFTNTNGHIAASSIDYTTGDVSVTFSVGDAPQNGSTILVLSATSTSIALGTY